VVLCRIRGAAIFFSVRAAIRSADYERSEKVLTAAVTAGVLGIGAGILAAYRQTPTGAAEMERKGFACSLSCLIGEAVLPLSL
jgi:hypothetical protein